MPVPRRCRTTEHSNREAFHECHASSTTLRKSSCPLFKKHSMFRSEQTSAFAGYFNLRGWKQLDGYVEKWSGADNSRCRLLVGMQRLPEDELRECLSLIHSDQAIDNQTALRLKRKLAEEFRSQLTFGVPTNQDEAGLRRLASQLKAGKLVVKLFLRHTLHAKLYLLFRRTKLTRSWDTLAAAISPSLDYPIRENSDI